MEHINQDGGTPRLALGLAQSIQTPPLITRTLASTTSLIPPIEPRSTNAQPSMIANHVSKMLALGTIQSHFSQDLSATQQFLMLPQLEMTGHNALLMMLLTVMETVSMTILPQPFQLSHSAP